MRDGDVGVNGRAGEGASGRAGERANGRTGERAIEQENRSVG